MVITAQRQTSLNYFLEWPPFYVVRGDPDGDDPPDIYFPKDHSMVSYLCFSFALEYH